MAERDLIRVENTTTCDSLMKGKPLTREDGVPFGPLDFLACISASIPSRVAEQPRPTADDAAERYRCMG